MTIEKHKQTELDRYEKFVQSKVVSALSCGKEASRFLGFELKESYFDQACLNLAKAESLGEGQQTLDMESAS